MHRYRAIAAGIEILRELRAANVKCSAEACSQSLERAVATLRNHIFGANAKAFECSNGRWRGAFDDANDDALSYDLGPDSRSPPVDDYYDYQLHEICAFFYDHGGLERFRGLPAYDPFLPPAEQLYAGAEQLYVD